MTISHSTTANYVTQSSLWRNPKLGKLTNRRIEYYRKLGYYSDGFKQQRKAIQQRKLNKNNNSNALKQLLDGLI